MKRILLATAATLALSLPAMAAPANTPADNSSSQQMNTPQQTSPSQMNNSSMQEKSGMQNGQSNMNNKMENNQQAQTNEQQRINPKRLSKTEVKDIQQALNKKGFSSGHVDGIWGRDTDTAIRDFQKKQGLPGDGHLNQQTLAALGVNVSQGEQGTVGTGNGSVNSGSMNSSGSMNNSGSMNSGSSQMNNSSMNKNQMNKNGGSMGTTSK